MLAWVAKITVLEDLCFSRRRVSHSLQMV